MCYLCFGLLQFLKIYKGLYVGKLLDNQKTIEFNTRAHKILFLGLPKPTLAS